MSTSDVSRQLRHGDGRWAEQAKSAPSRGAALKVDPTRRKISAALSKTREALAGVDPMNPRRDAAVDEAARHLFASIEATPLDDPELDQLATLEVSWARHNLSVADAEDSTSSPGSVYDAFGDVVDHGDLFEDAPTEPVSAEYRGFLNSTDNLCEILAAKGY